MWRYSGIATLMPFDDAMLKDDGELFVAQCLPIRLGHCESIRSRRCPDLPNRPASALCPAAMTTVYVEQRGIWHHVEREQDRDIVTAWEIVVADGR